MLIDHNQSESDLTHYKPTQCQSQLKSKSIPATTVFYLPMTEKKEKKEKRPPKEREKSCLSIKLSVPLTIASDLFPSNGSISFPLSQGFRSLTPFLFLICLTLFYSLLKQEPGLFRMSDVPKKALETDSGAAAETSIDNETQGPSNTMDVETAALYPVGIKLALITISLMLAVLCVALDNTVSYPCHIALPPIN